jgi:hypothetical protein
MLKALCIEQKRKGINTVSRPWAFPSLPEAAAKQIKLQRLSVKEEKYVPIDTYSSPLSR